MIDAELLIEWRYLYEERLGILCGADDPTLEQDAIARTEANARILELKEKGGSSETTAP